MPFGIFILDLKTAKWHYLFTTNEEGEHARHLAGK